MLSFNDRLLRAKVKGELTISDLSRWFCICRETVSKWTKGVKPAPFKLPRLYMALDALEQAIQQKQFPMPIETTQFERAKYLEAVCQGKFRAIPKPRATAAGPKVLGIFYGKGKP